MRAGESARVRRRKETYGRDEKVIGWKWGGGSAGG